MLGNLPNNTQVLRINVAKSVFFFLPPWSEMFEQFVQ